MSRPKGISDEEWWARERKRQNASRSANRDAFNAQRRDHYDRNKNKIRTRNKNWRWKPENHERLNEEARKRNKTPGRRKYIKEYRREEYKTNPVAREKVKARTRRYWHDGRGKKRHKEKMANDPIYAMGCRIRVRIAMALRKARKGTRKSTTTIKLLGCSFAEFKKHLEAQFTGDMTWEKVMSGEIHIDHIKPISSFDLTDPLQQKAAFHFTNCQPLWAADNISKGNKIIPFQKAA